ncbi:MAG: hypothetical protein Q9222_004373 [Ikaeria aurantiellina]
MMPVTRSTQYILFWYIAETLPPDVEAALSQEPDEERVAYQKPPPFPSNMALAERIEVENGKYEPVRHENTGVNEDEALYESYLLPVQEAQEKLKGTIMADVVRRGWETICTRRDMEEQRDGSRDR